MKNKRLWSLGLTGILVVSSCGCGAETKTAETVQETEEAVRTEEAAPAVELAKEAARRSEDKEAEKEETVYVNADANGTVQNITVSSWLKNGGGAAELTDVTTLKEVVNVKGDETFTQDGDTYVWAAGGNDIYYQGETSEELPVKVKVTYYLDEKEIDPKELAGKSGRMRIRFDYENRTSQKTVIGGEEAEVCVPFVAASTLILDSDRFVNVEVENGKILSDGKNTIVAGVAMPGLYDSLDLLNLEGFEDISIPEYVEVTADVTDFELGMTATILMPDVLSELNTDDMDGFDDLKDDIEELNDATYELIDGCVELDDGVRELKDNMPDLMDGVTELDDGATELNDGAWELDDGAQDLMDGADKLNDGAKDIREGAKELDTGAGTLQAGVGLLNDRMPQLTDGVDTLTAGLQSLQDPMMLGPDGKSGDAEHPYIKTSVGLLKNGVDTLAAGVGGMGAALEQSMAENQEKMQEAQKQVAVLTGELQKKVEHAQGIQKELTELAEQMGLLSAGGSTASAGEKTAEEHPTVSAPENATEEPSASTELPEKTTESITEDPAEESAQKTSVAEQDPKTTATPSEDPEAALDHASDALPGQSKVLDETAEESGAQQGNASDASTEKAGAQQGNVSDVSAENAGVQQGNVSDASAENAGTQQGNVSDASAENAGAQQGNASDASTEKPENLADPSSEASAAGEDQPAASAEEPAEQSGEAAKTEDFQEEEPSEFAGVYLEGLNRSGGMTAAGMVQMADQGQNTAIADPAAVIKGYQKVVALQTDLILELNQITDLQNQLREAATDYAGLAGADTALKQVAGQLSAGADAEQLAQLTEGMAALESSIGQIYDGVALINSRMGTLTGGAAQLSQGIGSLKNGADALKDGTKKLYQGGADLREGTKELYEGTRELKDGTEELKDGTGELKDGTLELKDGVVDLVEGVDELKDGTEELLDGVHEYKDDGIQKLYDTVNTDLQNVLDRVDAIADLSDSYQSFSGKSDAMKGSVKFIIETEAIELEEE